MDKKEAVKYLTDNIIIPTVMREQVSPHIAAAAISSTLEDLAAGSLMDQNILKSAYNSQAFGFYKKLVNENKDIKTAAETLIGN
jgi:hypothetical protein